MKQFGLIGKNLVHSFSKKYFEQKWQSLNKTDCEYHLFDINSIEEIADIFNLYPDLEGFNVTIPYKTKIIAFLDELTPLANETQSVNCIKKISGKWIGHNTDALAFQVTLKLFLPMEFNANALILGTGGSSKSVQWALNSTGISFDMASSSEKGIPYEELEIKWNPDWKLIINTSPIGMWPLIIDKPKIPYQFLDQSCYLYDLIYNPEKTLFLTLGNQQGSKIKNGLEMLHLQADKSWQFWNE